MDFLDINEILINNPLYPRRENKMNKYISEFFAFMKEPATGHFLLALVIFLVGVVYPSSSHVLGAIAAFFGVTGTITYTSK